MSVFTVVRQHELEAFLLHYRLGPLLAFSGIEAGIENTNYFVTTTVGEYVLTLFEFTPAQDLVYFLDLMAHLAEHGVPSAHPVADRDGSYLRCLHDKPTALVARLPGASIAAPTPAHCAAVGAAMARMHLATASFGGHRANDRGAAWRADVAALLRPRVSRAERDLLDAVLADDALERAGGLPAGVIHADLFRDNVLFDGEHLTGIIDFYYAYNGPFVYDLAVTVADWCFAGARLDLARARALLAAYHAVRPLAPAERAAWLAALRAAGARFWLSRLKDQHFPRPAALTHIKDPVPFRQVLVAAAAGMPELMAAWPQGTAS